MASHAKTNTITFPQRMPINLGIFTGTAHLPSALRASERLLASAAVCVCACACVCVHVCLCTICVYISAYVCVCVGGGGGGRLLNPESVRRCKCYILYARVCVHQSTFVFGCGACVCVCVSVHMSAGV